MILKNRQFKFRQQGSVLTISLLILLVLTIIGVSALSNSVMEEKMSANFQHERKAFQAAETAVNLTQLELAKDEKLLEDAEKAANNDQTSDPQLYFDDSENSALNFSAAQTAQQSVVRYERVVLPTNGSKINVGHANSMAWHSVKVTSTGTVNNTNARSEHIQGILKGPLAR